MSVETGGPNVQFGVNRRAGCTIGEIFNLAKIDRWFLVQSKKNLDFEEHLATFRN